VLTTVVSIFFTFLQATHFGTVVGVVKLPDSVKPLQGARIILLPPKYTEAWNKQVQTRLDNYWEIFKPDFAANKTKFLEFDRIAQVESFRYVVSMMRRELGDSASNLMKESSANGQFEFKNVPLGTYQLLVLGMVSGQDLIWSKTLDVQSDIPIFVDLGKPVS
jgi:hypothetical protein